MTERAILPWSDIDLPEGMSARLYDGSGPLPEGVDQAEVYVLPYGFGTEPPKLMSRLPSLKLVQTLSAGFEHLLPLVPDGVRLANGRGLHDLSVAEHALALIHAAQKNLPRWFAQQTVGSWDREHTRSLADSRVLLVGYGSIGKAIERQLVAAEAVVTRVASRARPEEGVHGVGELAQLLPSADIVVLILPETPATIGLLGAAELAALSEGALVVNVGRGSAIDTAALTAETVSGRLRAALDVVDPEPLPAGHPLWTAPGVVITPHVAGGSASFYPRAKRLVAEQLRRFAAGQDPLNPVN